jgi:hypothetical protein
LFAVAVVLGAERQPFGYEGSVKLEREMSGRKGVRLLRSFFQDDSFFKRLIEGKFRADNQGS